MSFYLAVELSALAIPLAFSFDRKVAFYRLWPFILPAIAVNALVFIILDIYFASTGAWGFNPQYHSEAVIAGLPLEELLFFFIIPYCSLFIHYVFIAYLPDTALPEKTTMAVTLLLILLLVAAAALSIGKDYTFFYSLLTAVILVVACLADRPMLSRFFITFLIIMIPFTIVNSILTGSFTEGSVFWYNPEAVSGKKLFSIPVEDVLFSFSMILLNLVFAGFFRKLLKR